MPNFCTNCGNRLGKYDNFCTNCGTKVDRCDDPLSKTMHDTAEIRKAKEELRRVVGGKFSFNKTFSKTLSYNGLHISKGHAIKRQVEKEIESGQIKSGGVEYRVNQLIVEYKTRMEKEKEEERKKSKMIDEIFESEEIKAEIRKNEIYLADAISIKENIKENLINKRENMDADEIRHFIKKELKKARMEQQKKERREQEKARREEEARIAKEKEIQSIQENKVYGGYCGLSCRHCYEEFLDSRGSIVGDFDDGGIFEYYCNLGHSVSFGRFCEDYE